MKKAVIIDALTILLKNLEADCRNEISDLHWYHKGVLITAPTMYNYIRYGVGNEYEDAFMIRQRRK
ncbi:hypothetical protein FQZ99_25385 [Escherichia coli]|nr:hypothetical protein [Escherichia coli]